jgi:hypothetical protein
VKKFSFLIWIVSTIALYTTILYSISMIWGVGDLFRAIDPDIDVNVSLRDGHKIVTGQIISMGTTLDSGSLTVKMPYGTPAPYGRHQY